MLYKIFKHAYSTFHANESYGRHFWVVSIRKLVQDDIVYWRHTGLHLAFVNVFHKLLDELNPPVSFQKQTIWGTAWQNLTKWPVCLANTQISLGICQVWSVLPVRMKKPSVLSLPLSALWRPWSDWVDAQADLSLSWVHRSLFWFCHAAAHLYLDWHNSEVCLFFTFGLLSYALTWKYSVLSWTTYFCLVWEKQQVGRLPYAC